MLINKCTSKCTKINNNSIINVLYYKENPQQIHTYQMMFIDIYPIISQMDEYMIKEINKMNK